MQQPPEKELRHSLCCDQCGVMLQRWSDGRDKIESFVLFWYYWEGKNLCSECAPSEIRNTQLTFKGLGVT